MQYLDAERTLKDLKKLMPPDRWKLPVLLAGAVFIGLFLYAFRISNAPSFLGDMLKESPRMVVLWAGYTISMRCFQYPEGELNPHSIAATGV